MENSLEIKVNQTTYNYQRPKLKKWVQLDELHSEIKEATTRKDTQQLKLLLSNFLVVAFSNSTPEVWLSLEWEKVFTLVNDILVLNKIRTILPLIDNKGTDKQDKKEVWEYSGRAWTYWAHMFARHYGWSLPQIEELEIEDAIALLEEIYLDNQFDMEWQWSLTEVAYPYNESTKKSSFRPLERPDWMKPIPEAPKKIKILKSMLPLGNVIDMNDLIPKKAK